MGDKAPPRLIRVGRVAADGGDRAAGRETIAVLEAARVLLNRDGYDALRIEEVADQSFMSRAAVQSLFPDRRRLLAALVRHDGENLLARMGPSLAAGRPLATTLADGLHTFLMFVDEHQAEYHVLFGRSATFEPEVAAILHDLRHRLAETYITMLRPVVEAAGIAVPSDGEARLVAHSLIALVEGAILAWLAEPEMERGKLEAWLLQMILRGILGVSGR
ncbi:MAG: TetR/AcrR family transcriptional regulator [Candidatus Dormibacteria bacterium]